MTDNQRNEAQASILRKLQFECRPWGIAVACANNIDYTMTPDMRKCIKDTAHWIDAQIEKQADETDSTS